MKLPADRYRRLVLLNSALLLAIFAAGLALVAVAVRDPRTRATLRAVLAREAQRSELIERLAGDGDGAPLERWGLHIDTGPMREIQALSAKLLDAEALADEDKRWFPAELLADGETWAGKVRLRGDLSTHWRGAKKSWRFRFKRDRLFRGFRQVDLIVPHDKGYEVELEAYRAARELGLFAPAAGFVNASLNGVDMGVYFWREPPGREALEKLRYPEGEIFAEQNTWIQEFHSGRGIYRLYSPPISYFPANWHGEVHPGTPPAGIYAARWNRLLALIAEADDESFARQLPTLLEVEKYLTWNALTWLFGSTHSHWGDNLSWFYDPTVGRFEPLLYDVFRYRIENRKLGTFEADEHDELAVRVLRRPAWRQRRNEILWRLVNEPQFDLGARCAAAGALLVAHLTRGVDAPLESVVQAFRGETVEILDANRALLHRHLAFGRLFTAAALAVDGEEAALRIELVPDALSRLLVGGLTLHLAPGSSVDPAAVRATLAAPAGTAAAVALEARRSDDGIALRFPQPLALDTALDARLVPQMAIYRLTLTLPGVDLAAWRTPGALLGLDYQTRHSLTGEALPPSHLYQAEPAAVEAPPAPPVEAAAGEAGGLDWRLDGDTLVVPAGTYRLRHDLVLPPGHGLRLEAGVRLELGPGVSVLLRGPLEVAGSAARPVELVPLDAGGAPWGGLGVVAAGAPSTVRHLVVRGGSEDWIDGVFLSGQLCFYRSDVELERSAILGARADDGLNIKHAAFTIRDSTFAGNAADAFDGDWVRGEIVDSRFVDNLGDGADFSGAEVTVRGSLFAGMGDKGLSIGERSTVVAINNVVRDSLIGVAIKDLSTASLVASVLYGNGTALALYRKKPIFGGGTGTVVGTLLWNNEADYQLDAESALSLVGVAQETATAVDGVTVEDPRAGALGEHYRQEGGAGFRFIGGAGSPFARGPAVPLDLEAPDLPDLTTVPIGLLVPLDLERCPPARDSS